MSLEDLRNALATNTLSSQQSGALVAALDLIIPIFPAVDNAAQVTTDDEAIRVANLWAATLYYLRNIAGGSPVAGVNSVTADAPLENTGTASDVVLVLPNATESTAGAMSAADKTKLDGLSSQVSAVTGNAPITSSGGTTPAIGITAATELAAGSMSAADKIKLDGLPSAPVASVTGNAPITSSGGTTPAIGITAASEVAAGSMSAADKTKLDGITAGAAVASVTGNAPITSSGGTTPAIGITAASDSAAGSMSAADKTKLDGITAGAAVASVTGNAPITSSGGTTPAIGITAATDSAAGSMSAADKTKIDNLPLVFATISALGTYAGSFSEDGVEAKVQSNASVWNLRTGTLTTDGITVIASSFAGKQWVRTSTYSTEYLQQASWFVNANTGSDEATGSSSGAPVKTLAEIMRRWVGVQFFEVTLSVTPVTITLQTDVPNSDTINWTVHSIGASNQLTIIGTPIAVGGALTLTTFTAANKATGTPAQVTVTGHTWTAGQLVHDTTLGLAWWVRANTGGGASTITNPVATPVALPYVSPGTPVAGNALQVYRNPDLPVDALYGNQTESDDPSFILQNVNLTNGSGTGIAQCSQSVGFFECSFDSTYGIASLSRSISFLSTEMLPNFMNCHLSSFVGAAIVQAGIITQTATPSSIFYGSTVLDFDVIVENGWTVGDTGPIFIGTAGFFGGFPNTDNSPPCRYIVNGNNGGSSVTNLWGTATVSLRKGQTMAVIGTTYALALTNTGALSLDGVTTAGGWYFTGATGIFQSTGGVNVTQANIDTHGGLQNPQTGSKFL